MTSLINKARRPKFDLHIKIYDLNNVPLVSGSSFIKWHLSHSMHAEHRGRTGKCPIANHRVDYAFAKRVPSIRLSVDRANNLAECPLELEIVQEFALAEKITLGHIKLNLSEYIEESEAFSKDPASPQRKRSSSAGVSPTAAPQSGRGHHNVDDGIVRRYLMHDSKVNSTLKISILMVQVDGDRHFIAPALRTAPVFGGIAGLMVPEIGDDDTGPVPSISKPRDTSEVQDLYRRTLAASWSRQPSELPADECIEDIFSGGNGWKTTRQGTATPESEDEDTEAHNGTLRPSDFRRLAQQHHQHHHGHRRTHSGSSDKSVSTVTGRTGGGGGNTRALRITREDARDSRSSGGDDTGRSRSDSLASLTPTLGSDRSRGDVAAYRTQREVSETEAREDLVAWRLPGGLAA